MLLGEREPESSALARVRALNALTRHLLEALLLGRW